MSDNEIIKALECCRKPVSDCECCPVEYGGMCFDNLKTLAIDLINRQKAEIERLYIALEENQKATRIWKDIAHRETSYVEKAKAEAIKEFAERLKKSTLECDVSFGYGREHYTEVVAVVEIDNLVQEMTGEER